MVLNQVQALYPGASVARTWAIPSPSWRIESLWRGGRSCSSPTSIGPTGRTRPRGSRRRADSCCASRASKADSLRVNGRLKKESRRAFLEQLTSWSPVEKHVKKMIRKQYHETSFMILYCGVMAFHRLNRVSQEPGGVALLGRLPSHELRPVSRAGGAQDLRRLGIHVSSPGNDAFPRRFWTFARLFLEAFA